MKWYLAYISAVPGMMYFDSVEKYGDYDEYYGPEDYRVQIIEPLEDELIFELSVDGKEKLEAFTIGRLNGVMSYDVYVSKTGEKGDFMKDGTFAPGYGITKYAFNKDYDVKGDYAIMLKRPGGEAISASSRARDTLTVMTKAVQEADNPDDSDVPDIPVTPDDSTLEEDLSVPSTAGNNSEVVAGKPNTGKNNDSKGMDGIVLSILSGLFITVPIAIFVRGSNKSHRKFDW